MRSSRSSTTDRTRPKPRPFSRLRERPCVTWPVVGRGPPGRWVSRDCSTTSTHDPLTHRTSMGQMKNLPALGQFIGRNRWRVQRIPGPNFGFMMKTASCVLDPVAASVRALIALPRCAFCNGKDSAQPRRRSNHLRCAACDQFWIICLCE
jgi:hypothetical protein